MDFFTAAESMTVPSWNLTPSRRWKVHSVPSALGSQLVASSGVNFSAAPGGLMRNSCSYTFAMYSDSVEKEATGSQVVILAVLAILSTSGAGVGVAAGGGAVVG